MPILRPLLLPFAVALALGACSDSTPPPPSAPAEAPAAAASAPPPPAPLPEAAPPASSDAPATIDPGLEAALSGAARSPENIARDVWRHPRETLAFFGVQPTHTVIEITPGGGWYAEILAPWLRDGGRYIGAIFDPSKQANERARDYYVKSNDALRAKFAANPEAYDRATLVEVDAAAPVFGAPDSADVVLTFRNVHNWMSAGNTQAMFDGFFAVLKPGGTLGIVEHRANADVPEGDKSGYVSEGQVVAFAKAAGFDWVDGSEINANPKDSKDHPNGVWTLPPTLRVPEGTDAQKYRDIGESDRMTLKFVKPATPAPSGG